MAAACSAIQLAGFVLPLVTTEGGVLVPAALVVGAAAGTTTKVRRQRAACRSCAEAADTPLTAR